MRLDDEYVLYTDVDVMFVSDVADYLPRVRPTYFAVAPEGVLSDYVEMNTGVMVMNLPRLRECDERFRELIVLNLETFCTQTWDQAAYRQLFRNEQGEPLWDRLDPRFNWKPYWGLRPDVRILHFHGPKPYQDSLLGGPSVPENLKFVATLTRGCYPGACKKWRRLLAEANES
jgi:hypothetical protein